MGTPSLQQAYEELSKLTPGATLGLESRVPLTHLVTGFSSMAIDIARSFVKDNLVAPFTADYNVSQALSKLDKVNYVQLNKFTIRTPEGVSGPMLPYLETLDAALDDLMDIKSRLLDPLKQWCGKALANPGHIEKVWLDNNISFVDVDKHIAALALHYNDQVGDDISFAPISTIYPRAKDFDACRKMVQDISKESAKVLGDDIPKLAEDIATLVSKLVKANEESEYMNKVPTTSIAKLSESLYHAAREIELLSVVLFQVKVACVAFDESITKINSQL